MSVSVVIVYIIQKGHDNRMLLGLAFLIPANETYHVILPLHGFSVALVRYFVENIVQIIQRVHNLPHISFLDGGHGMKFESVNLFALTVSVGITVDPVDIILGIKWVPRPGINSTAPFVVNGEPIEEHHHYIKSPISRR